MRDDYAAASDMRARYYASALYVVACYEKRLWYAMLVMRSAIICFHFHTLFSFITLSFSRYSSRLL